MPYPRDLKLGSVIREFFVLVSPPDPVPVAPVIVLTGPQGAGKTAFLEWMDDELADTPHAYVDLTDGPQDVDRALIDALGRIAFRLSEGGGTQPRLKLDVLNIAMLAAASEIAPTERGALLQHIADTAMPSRNQASSQIVQELAKLTLQTVPLGAQVVPLLQPLREAVGASRNRHRLMGLIGSLPTPKYHDIAASINDRYHASPRERHKIEELLVQTLLMDIRRAQTSALRRHEPFTARPTLLLDHAESELGRRLLPLLIGTRSQSFQAVDTVPDPALIIAASRHRFAPEPPNRPYAQVPGGLTEGPAASVRDWQGRYGDTQPVYPIAMRPPTFEELIEQLAPLFSTHPEPPRLKGADRWLAWSVHRLTAGHPGAVGELCTLLTDEIPPGDEWGDLLAGLFDAPGGHAAGTGAGPDARLLGKLFNEQDLPGSLIPLLPRLAAAVDLDEAESANGLWQADQPAHTAFVNLDESKLPLARFHGLGETPSELHPLARYLLLRRLAERAGAGTGSWVATHETLIQRARAAGEAGQEPGPARLLEHRHALALHRVTQAVTYLHGRFTDPDVRPADVHADLLVIARAPNRFRALHRQQYPRVPAQTPRDLFLAAVPANAATPAHDALARALVGQWLLNDPLIDPYADLNEDVGHAFIDLSQHATVASDHRRWRDIAALYREKPWL